VTCLRSIAVRRSAPRPVRADEVVPAAGWRAVCEEPGGTPAEMAVHAGKSALSAAGAAAAEVQWVLHAGSGPQGSQGWPVHHHIQNRIVGGHGNALEVKQNCAGGLTAWVLASRLVDDGAVSICTGADNWSWSDRFVNSRVLGGEPLSDVAHAAVISQSVGFAKLLGVGTASYPDLADDWLPRAAFWESTAADDFGGAYDRATSSRSNESLRASFRMFGCAVNKALREAKLSPQYVTHLVPPGSGTGQPYRLLAEVMGLPWSVQLHEHTLDHGYLGVSTQAEGLVHLAETDALRKDSIVLLLAAEYQLSATAIVVRVIRPPSVVVDGMTRVIA
jgi:3-oxoacyl-[acyl-carrier-protein] synthase III